MNITIMHLGGSEKVVQFESFDAPRAWAVLRYPNGGGLFSFGLSHGFIEVKRGLHPEWRISDGDLEALRAQAKELKIRFTVSPFTGWRATKPRAPRKKTEQKQTELFAEER